MPDLGSPGCFSQPSAQPMLVRTCLTPPQWLRAHGTLRFRRGCPSFNPPNISTGIENEKGKLNPLSYHRTWSGNDESLKRLGKSYPLSRLRCCSHWLYHQSTYSLSSPQLLKTSTLYDVFRKSSSQTPRGEVTSPLFPLATQRLWFPCMWTWGPTSYSPSICASGYSTYRLHALQYNKELTQACSPHSPVIKFVSIWYMKALLGPSLINKVSFMCFLACEIPITPPEMNTYRS